MKRLAAIFLAVSILITISTTNAQTVVDPDAFPVGTILNNMYPGVTLSALGDPGVLTNNDVIALASASASTGSLVFGDNEPGNTDSWGNGAWDYLRADFDAETLWVSLDFASNDAGGDDNAELVAYNSSGVEIDRDGPHFVAAGTYLTLTVNGPGIAYIEAYWDNIVKTENGVLDHLVYLSIIEVAVDIKPTSCPNPLNVKSQGVLPVAILGTDGFDVSLVDLDTIHLESVAPVKIDYEDVATPFDGELCDCHEAGPDGFLDLILYFDTQELVAALEPVADNDELILTLTGEVIDGTPIEGSDCIRIIKKGKD